MGIAAMFALTPLACAVEPLPPPPGVAVVRSDETPQAAEPPPPPPDIRDDPACKLFQWPLSASRASDILTHTETFADTGIYIGGEPPPQIAAFNVLLDQPDPTRWFDDIARSGGSAGRLYALCALRLLDVPKAAYLAAELRSTAAQVATQFGCIGGDQDVAELVDAIEKHDYGTRFREARARTFNYYQRDVNLCTQPRRHPAASAAAPANYRMQQTVWTVTARAKGARSAPAQPAADAGR